MTQGDEGFVGVFSSLSPVPDTQMLHEYFLNKAMNERTETPV